MGKVYGRDEPAGNLLSLDRAISLLAAVTHSAQGLRLTDAATATGLSSSTAHRILSALVEHRLLRVPAGERRYLPGTELYRLGIAAARHFSLVELARPSLQALAEATQDTISLSILDGDQALCLDRIVGSYPIKTLALEIGERRPLGVGAGSLALLAALPRERRREIIHGDRHRVARHPQFTTAALTRWADDAARRGYAYSPQRVLEGMSAVGVAIPAAPGRPLASISVSGIAQRVRGERLKDIVARLHAARTDIVAAASALLVGSATPPPPRRRRTRATGGP